MTINFHWFLVVKGYNSIGIQLGENNQQPGVEKKIPYNKFLSQYSIGWLSGGVPF